MAGIDGLMWGLDEDKDDKFRLDDVHAKAPEVMLHHPPYFPEQAYLGGIIFDRIKFILKKCYQPSRSLKDFNKFEYQIFTARFKMLQSQTTSRLCDPIAQCLPPEIMKQGTQGQAKFAANHVHLYDERSYQGAFCALERRVREEPQTLFLIVCDEAHWGVAGESTDTDDNIEQKNANYKIVNTWNSSTHPNAFVLLVTATPYNLLSRKRLVPWTYTRENADGEKEILKVAGRNLRYQDADCAPLNILSWMDVMRGHLKHGLVTKLKVFLPHGQPMRWLKMNSSATMHAQIVTTSDSSDASHFLLKGDKHVRISSVDGEFCLCVVEKKLVFVHFALYHNKPLRRTFQVQSDFGMDLIGLKVIASDPGSNFVCYDATQDTLVLCSNPAPTDQSFTDVFVDRSMETLFLLDAHFLEEQCGPGTTYVSLNHYYSSMRNERVEDQLIRRDQFFVRMCKQIVKKKRETADHLPLSTEDVLIADYAVFVLCVPLIWSLNLPTVRSFKALFHCLKYAVIHEHTQRIDEVLRWFRDELPDFTSSLISRDVFYQVSSYYVEYLKDGFAQCIWRLRTLLFQKKEGEIQVACEFLLRFTIYCILLLDTEGLNDVRDIVSRNFDVIRKLDDNRLFECHQYESVLVSIKQNLSGPDPKLPFGTSHIVNKLMLSDLDTLDDDDLKHLQGHMKIVRFSTNEVGNRMYSTLIRARHITAEHISSNLKYSFEILRDFDKNTIEGFEENPSIDCECISNNAVYRIKRRVQPDVCEDVDRLSRCHCTKYKCKPPNLVCVNCSHYHRKVHNYEDLDGVPVLLILVGKGRMGDTFPRSLHTMDLRLTAKSSKSINLSSVTQELGRICRYHDFRLDGPLPYVLVSEGLGSILEKQLTRTAVFFACFGHKYDSFRKIHPKQMENQKMGDVVNQKNRLLMFAESQVGKTGAYLNVIQRLNLEINHRNVDGNDSSSDEEEDELSLDDSDDPDTCDKCRSDEVELMKDWNYPKEKLLKNLQFRHDVHKGRYVNVLGPYEPGSSPPCIRFGLQAGHSVTKKPNKGPKQRHEFEASNEPCEIRYSSSVALLQLNGVNGEVKISIPSCQSYLPVFHKFDLGVPFVTSPSQRSYNETLESWIFTPSYGRATKASVNLSRTMVTIDKEPVWYVHVLVVQPQEFDVYCKLWSGSHAIIALPQSMDSCENDVTQGGIGFARHFIQKLAEDKRLPYIFMMDDNVRHLFEADSGYDDEVGEEVLVRNAGHMVPKNVPLSRVLKHLEDIAMQKMPEQKLMIKEMGPPEQYGIYGLLRCSRYATRTKTAFSRKHVMALTLLNIETLRRKNVRYASWMVREDLDFNSRVELHGLWVVKFSRYLLHKRVLRDWLPDVYYWSNSDHLGCPGDRMQLPPAENEAHILRRHIHAVSAPSRIEEMGVSSIKIMSDRYKEVLNPVLQQLRMEKSPKDYHLVAFHVPATVTPVFCRPFRDLLWRYFKKTKGIGGFDMHVIVLPAFLCCDSGFHSVKAIWDYLRYIFSQDFKMFVCCSHSVNSYNVQLVVIHVHGKVEIACDEEATTNVEGAKRKRTPRKVPHRNGSETRLSRKRHSTEKNDDRKHQRLSELSEGTAGGAWYYKEMGITPYQNRYDDDHQPDRMRDEMQHFEEGSGHESEDDYSASGVDGDDEDENDGECGDGRSDNKIAHSFHAGDATGHLVQVKGSFTDAGTQYDATNRGDVGDEVDRDQTHSDIKSDSHIHQEELVMMDFDLASPPSLGCSAARDGWRCHGNGVSDVDTYQTAASYAPRDYGSHTPVDDASDMNNNWTCNHFSDVDYRQNPVSSFHELNQSMNSVASNQSGSATFGDESNDSWPSSEGSFQDDRSPLNGTFQELYAEHNLENESLNYDFSSDESPEEYIRPAPSVAFTRMPVTGEQSPTLVLPELPRLSGSLNDATRSTSSIFGATTSAVSTRPPVHAVSMTATTACTPDIATTSNPLSGQQVSVSALRRLNMISVEQYEVITGVFTMHSLSGLLPPSPISSQRTAVSTDVELSQTIKTEVQ